MRAAGRCARRALINSRLAKVAYLFYVGRLSIVKLHNNSMKTLSERESFFFLLILKIMRKTLKENAGCKGIDPS